MNKKKKKELAEMDSRWDFEKTVQTRYEDSWDAVLNTFNHLQENQGDLYMQVDKFPMPSRLERWKLKYKEYKNSNFMNEVTFHHSQVYDWFLKLANHLDLPVGEVYNLAVYNVEDLREELDLGDTVNVEVNNMGDMAQPKESKVSKDELQEMIDDD